MREVLPGAEALGDASLLFREAPLAQSCREVTAAEMPATGAKADS